MQKTSNPLVSKVYGDYEQNFMVGLKITITLSKEEVAEFLKNSETNTTLQVNPRFKLYASELFLKSFEKFKNDGNTEDVLTLIADLHEQIKFNSTPDMRSLVALVEVKFFIEHLTDEDLYKIFWDYHISDDYSKRVAFEEYQKRIANQN